jgi:hypothetical protein
MGGRSRKPGTETFRSGGPGVRARRATALWGDDLGRPGSRARDLAYGGTGLAISRFVAVNPSFS